MNDSKNSASLMPWQRLAAELRARIEVGDLKPGQPAPSITALSSGHATARHTGAMALRSLEADGLLIRHPGLGYYVAGPKGV